MTVEPPEYDQNRHSFHSVLVTRNSMNHTKVVIDTREILAALHTKTRNALLNQDFFK